MKKQEVDHILTRMLDSHKNVSDLNFTAGKPMQVESDGDLMPIEMKPSFKELTPFQIEVFALNLINQEKRLTDTLVNEGSCDLSYNLPGKARFRVNVFSQKGCYAYVRVDEDIRNQIDYGSESFKKDFNLRTGSERVFSRLLSICMQNAPVIGFKATANYVTIAHITVLLVALTAAKSNSKNKIRFIKSFLPNLNI